MPTTQAPNSRSQAGSPSPDHAAPQHTKEEAAARTKRDKDACVELEAEEDDDFAAEMNGVP